MKDKQLALETKDVANVKVETKHIIEPLDGTPYALFKKDENEKGWSIICGGQLAHPRSFKRKWEAKLRARFPHPNMTIIAALTIIKTEKEKWDV